MHGMLVSVTVQVLEATDTEIESLPGSVYSCVSCCSKGQTDVTLR